MYQIDDIVVYESSGVCRVRDIQELTFSEAAGAKRYYVLTPLFSSGDVIYTPVDSTKTVLRPVISREEALETIHSMQGEEVMSFEGLRPAELNRASVVRISCVSTAPSHGKHALRAAPEKK